MSDAKELVERLRLFDAERPEVCEEAADWIERWAPVIEKARAVAEEWHRVDAREGYAPACNDATKLCERLNALAAALGEDKP